MGQLRLGLRRADADDFEVVHGLLTEASLWLESKGTDQWARPWPDEDGRNERIMGAIDAGRTWIAWDEDVPAATLTASPNPHGIWPDRRRRRPAVYIRRLVVSRPYAGNGLGGQLLDWAGTRAAREYGARWIRVDVWTTNTKLHEYYRQQGFKPCGLCKDPSYPSGALFQKSIRKVKPSRVPLFRVVLDTA